jgi:hypothetical protein
MDDPPWIPHFGVVRSDIEANRSVKPKATVWSRKEDVRRLQREARGEDNAPVVQTTLKGRISRTFDREMPKEDVVVNRASNKVRVGSGRSRDREAPRGGASLQDFRSPYRE